MPDSPDALKASIAYNGFGAYCVPLSSRHRPAARMVLSGGVWEADTIALLRARCGAGDVVHAGTYFGDFLPGVARALAPDAVLWAFEPSRENYRCARVTVELNELGNVRLAHAGLTDHAGAGLVVTADATGRALGGASRLLASRSAPGAVVEAVPLVTVDARVPGDRAVSVLQLDVEGHEEAALRGAIGTIRRCRPLLVLEVTPQTTWRTSAWFHDEVLSLGYRDAGLVCGNVVLEPT